MHDSAALTPQKVRQWPPREGLPFFLLWIAGYAVLSAVMTFWMWKLSATTSGVFLPPGLRFFLRCIPAMGLGLAAWQGYLLFQDWRRVIVWAILGLFPIARVFVWHSPMPLLSLPTEIALMQFFVLRGVRRHASLWIVLVLLAILLETVAFGRVHSAISSWLSPLLSPIGLPSQLTRIAVMNGVHLSTAVLSAAALAWWMPPLQTTGRESAQNANSTPTQPDPQ